MSQMNDQVRAAAEFRRNLLPAKKAADDLLAHLGRVLTTVATISKDRAPNAIVGAPTLEEIGTAISGTLGVRGGLIRIHVAAHQAGRVVLPELSYGDIRWTEPEGKLAQDAPTALQDAA